MSCNFFSVLRGGECIPFVVLCILICYCIWIGDYLLWCVVYLDWSQYCCVSGLLCCICIQWWLYLVCCALVYQQQPDLIREGGSIPVTLSLQEATNQNVCLLSLGCGDDGAHSQNEKMDRRNYIEGVSSHAQGAPSGASLFLQSSHCSPPPPFLSGTASNRIHSLPQHVFTW